MTGVSPLFPPILPLFSLVKSSHGSQRAGAPLALLLGGSHRVFPATGTRGGGEGELGFFWWWRRYVSPSSSPEASSHRCGVGEPCRGTAALQEWQFLAPTLLPPSRTVPPCHLASPRYGFGEILCLFGLAPRALTASPRSVLCSDETPCVPPPSHGSCSPGDSC